MIGLGQMGGPMADHVIDAGHTVAVYDIAEGAVASRVAKGARRASSPADAAVAAEVVSIVVFDDDQLLEVCCGPDGVLMTLDAGATIAIHTTATVDTIRAVAAAAEDVGVAVIDAGISGGETGARAGTLMLLVGGDSGAVAHATPVIDSFAKDIVHAGPLGTGMALKLARNSVGYAWMCAVHDAMEIAVGAGVDPALLRHALEGTGAFEQALVVTGLGGPEPFPSDSPTIAMFDHVAKLADKDLEHALALAAEVGRRVPVLEVSRAEFRRAVRLGP